MQRLMLEKPKRVSELLSELGIDGDLVMVYDRRKDRIVNGDEEVYEPVIISKISGG